VVGELYQISAAEFKFKFNRDEKAWRNIFRMARFKEKDTQNKIKRAVEVQQPYYQTKMADHH